MNEGAVSAVLGLRGWPAVGGGGDHRPRRPAGRPRRARGCTCATSRTAGSVDIIRRAKERGIDVTAEVTPHHLLLTDDLVAELRPRVQGQSAVADRSADVEALREGLADGTIDVVATDHAPHTARGQGLRVGRRGVRDARSADGAVGGDRRPWSSTGAPGLGRVSPSGCRSLRPGSVGWPTTADPSPWGSRRTSPLVDADAVWTVDPADFPGPSRNSPYRGMELPGRVVATFLRGRPTVLAGAVGGGSSDRRAALSEQAAVTDWPLRLVLTRPDTAR